MNVQLLVTFFQNYISAFKQFDLAAVQAFYQLPCTLHTPDKIAYLANSADFEREFIDVFTVLKHAKIQNIKVTKATFNESISGSIDVCVDWTFIDDNDEVFADFCAFYHVIKLEEKIKIISVVSHELSNSVELSSRLTISH
jgi:hypothetical protein